MPTMDSRTALFIAKAVLEKALQASPTGSFERRQFGHAMGQIEQIIAQRGCEHFDPAIGDGRLTSLMDLVIYG